MKDLITSIASLLIIMMFLMQFAANHLTYAKIIEAESNIRDFALSSENKGETDGDDVTVLRNHLAQIMECSPGEIIISIVQEENRSNYEITLPLKELIGPARMLGISPEENTGRHISRGIIEYEPEETDDGAGEEEGKENI